MIASLYEALVKAGPATANISLIVLSFTAVGAIAWYVANRKYRAIEKESHATIVSQLEKTIDLHKKRADDMEKEWNHYRDLLHTEKAAHQGTLLKVAELEARVRELESRPSVDMLYRQQTEWQNEQRRTMEGLTQAVMLLNQNIEKLITRS